MPDGFQKHNPAISKELHIFEQGPENTQLCFFLFSNNSSFSDLNNGEGEDTKNKIGIVFLRNFLSVPNKETTKKTCLGFFERRHFVWGEGREGKRDHIKNFHQLQ